MSRPIVTRQAGEADTTRFKHVVVDAPDAVYRAVDIEVGDRTVVIRERGFKGQLGAYDLDVDPDVHPGRNGKLRSLMGAVDGLPFVAAPDPTCTCNTRSRKDVK